MANGFNNLNSKGDKLYVNKLEAVPTYLSQLNDVVKLKLLKILKMKYLVCLT